MKAPKRKVDAARVKYEAQMNGIEERERAAEQMAGLAGAESGQTFGAGQSWCPIREPALIKAAESALEFLTEAQEQICEMRVRLFSENFSHTRCVVPERLSFESLIRRLSTGSACLVGELRTIAGKLG